MLNGLRHLNQNGDGVAFHMYVCKVQYFWIKRSCDRSFAAKSEEAQKMYFRTAVKTWKEQSWVPDTATAQYFIISKTEFEERPESCTALRENGKMKQDIPAEAPKRARLSTCFMCQQPHERLDSIDSFIKDRSLLKMIEEVVAFHEVLHILGEKAFIVGHGQHGKSARGIACTQTGCRVYQRMLETPENDSRSDVLRWFVGKLLEHDIFDALIKMIKSKYSNKCVMVLWRTQGRRWIIMKLLIMQVTSAQPPTLVTGTRTKGIQRMQVGALWIGKSTLDVAVPASSFVRA
jgi:hypothetical protein